MLQFVSKQVATVIRQKIKSKIKAMEEIVKNYQYSQDAKHAENMIKLVSALQKQIFPKGQLNGFLEYLQHDENIPIQVNFKPLKIQYLKLLLEDWLSSHQDNSVGLGLDRFDTLKTRNTLFKKILAEKKETIDEYFCAFYGSKCPCLKGFDLYQLFVQIISSQFYLYQYNSDSQTFFDKVNSFEVFSKLVEKFENYQKRQRPFKNNKTMMNDPQYIKRFQFDMFIEFWQQTNPQLTLLQKKRYNLVHKGVETTQISFVDQSVQSQGHFHLSLLQIINRAIHDLNIVLEKENHNETLESMERIFDCLRKQKINVTRLIAQQQISDSHTFKTKTKVSQIDKRQTNFLRVPQNRTPTKSPKTVPPLNLQPEYINKFKISNFSGNREKSRQRNQNLQVQSPSRDENYQILASIYDYYCDKMEYLDLTQMNHFFQDFGLINQGDTYLAINILDSRLVRDARNIKLAEFIRVVKSLMKEDRSFNYFTIEQFYEEISKYNLLASPKYNLLTPQFSPKYNLLNPHDQTIKSSDIGRRGNGNNILKFDQDQKYSRINKSSVRNSHQLSDNQYIKQPALPRKKFNIKVPKANRLEPEDQFI